MPSGQAQVLDDGEVLEEMRLVADERNQALGFDRLADDVMAADEDGSSRRTVDAGDAAEGGGLACSVGADQADDLTRGHVE